MLRPPRLARPCAALLLAAVKAFGAGAFTHFEARQTHPVELSLDGGRVFAVNSPEGRLSVFSLSGSGRDHPVLSAEIPVGLEPVAVRARTADEVWVVNEVSDSISVVSLADRMVTATIACPDEPADVVFAGNRAFVSGARNRRVLVFDAATHRQLAEIPLAGLQPRSLAVDPEGSRVWVGFLNSGNGTTVIPAALAPPPEAPGDPSLGPAPATALIVDAGDPRVRYAVLDHDLAEIPVEAPDQVRYYGGLGTSIFGVAARPGSREIWVGNTEANNRLRYEPRLAGRFVSNRVSRLDLATGNVRVHDLSPFDEQGAACGPGGREGALAQPMDIVFAPDGRVAWVAAFASDRVARIEAVAGDVSVRVELRGAGEGSERMRGPRGLAWDAGRQRLYVLNKLSSSLSTVDTSAGRVLSEVELGSFDAWPAAARAGRGLLFDARLSGNGASACGSCHIDADVDGLAWDLGNPEGRVVVVTGANLAVHDPSPRDRVMHPMKGPMVTQTLRGLDPGKRLHWRGDRATLQDFNPTFRDLLQGGLREPREIEQLAAYLATLRHHPNPNRNPDNSLREDLGGGNAARGEKLFGAHLHHCGVCHVLPKGTDNSVDDPRNLRLSQPVQNPSLPTAYQRALFDGRAGATNLTGFGLLHDGTGSAVGLPTVHFYDLDALSGTLFDDVKAFVLSFDSGTAAVVGRSLSVTSGNRDDAAVGAELNLLEGEAVRSNRCDLVVRGRLRGGLVECQFLAGPARYDSGRVGWNWTRGELLAALGPGDVLTFLAVLPGDARRGSVDHDGDGRADAKDPPPVVGVRRTAAGGVQVEWPATPGWVLESAADLVGPWVPQGRPVTETTAGPSIPSRQFFRLRRTW